MFKKTDEIKVMRDPVHEYIHIEYQVIWDAINSKEFQRMRRIHQMGTSYLVYHTAEHSRFSHCLGVYEITRRMCTEVKDIQEYLSEDEKIQVMLAGLLHDLGHGPFSHFFEMVTSESHESMTKRIILEDSEIHSILEKAQEGLSEKVANILDHSHPKVVLTQMISSQLDADRMDYLLRDATFSGTTYGHFDLERILRTMRVQEGKLVIKVSGIHSIEDYIMARYHMYYQVYFHPTSRAVEGLILGFFKRFLDLRKQDESYALKYPMFDFLGQKGLISIHKHQQIDEASCFYGFQCCLKDEDKILSDIANRILDRHLFMDVDYIDEKQIEEIKVKLDKKGLDANYYLYQDEMEKNPYSPYNEENSLIYILMNDLSVRELSDVSRIVKAVVNTDSLENRKVFYPKEGL